MRFEWDENKLRENLRKHGFDFVDAWKVFANPMLEELDVRNDYGEDRWIGIGMLDGRIVVVVYAERKNDGEETIRIISLRKALSHERIKYGKSLRDRLGAH